MLTLIELKLVLDDTILIDALRCQVSSKSLAAEVIVTARFLNECDLIF